jgi:hypothetical protein
MGNTLTVILFILGAIGLYRVLDFLMAAILVVKKAWEKSKMYRELENKRKELLKKGENHSWVEVTGPDGTKITVCEKTGWCPSRNSFLSLSTIKALKAIDKTEREYEAFKKQEMEEIATKNNMTPAALESLYVELLKIKPKFYLMRMKSFLEDVKEGKNV